MSASEGGAGMVEASVLGIFLIPMLYIVFQRLAEGRGKKDPEPKAAVPAETP